MNARSDLSLSMPGFGFRPSCDLRVTVDLFLLYLYYHRCIFVFSMTRLSIGHKFRLCFLFSFYTDEETVQVLMS